MNEYEITDTVLADEMRLDPTGIGTVQLGDKIHLTNQEQEVVVCQETGVKMLNIDANQLAKGDLTFIKKLGLTISNPDTDKPVALGVDYKDDSFGNRVASFLAGAAVGSYSSRHDDDDDSSFFSSSGSFGGGSSFGGFGGFGGGSFSGGGASGSF